MVTNFDVFFLMESFYITDPGKVRGTGRAHPARHLRPGLGHQLVPLLPAG